MGRDDSELLRLLRGDLPEGKAGALRQRLAQDGALRADLAALERVWRALDQDPAVLPRPGFSTAVLARARAEGRPGASLAWSQAPAWARVAAVLALILGAAIGSSLMLVGRSDAAAAANDASAGAVTMTLADDYAAALQLQADDDPSVGSGARQ